MPVAIRSVASGLLSILVNYILIVQLKYGYMGWYVGSFMGGFLINSTYWYSLNKKLSITPIYNFKKRTIYKTMKVSLPMIPHYYSVFMINTFNRIVMDQSSISIGKIGEYNIAQQFSHIMESGIMAIEKAITPMCMIEIKNKNEFKLKKLTYFKRINIAIASKIITTPTAINKIFNTFVTERVRSFVDGIEVTCVADLLFDVFC